MYKTLIVNADDFGLTHSINNGILKCFKYGIVTSASIITNGRAFEESVSLSKEHGLNVGLHLTLMDGQPVSNAEDVKSLTDRNGLFPTNYLSFSMNYFLSRISLNDIESEFRAQICKFIDAGLVPKHINGHNHVHMFPRILDITLKLMDEYNIKVIRAPFSRIFPAMSNISLNSFAKLFLILLSKHSRRKISKFGFNTPDHFEGLFCSGRLTKKDIIKVLDRLKAGTTELMCHPGYSDNESVRIYPWNYKWEEELKALCDDDVKKIVEKQGIRLEGF